MGRRKKGWTNSGHLGGVISIAQWPNEGERERKKLETRMDLTSLWMEAHK